jgi:hypothetical protein
MKRFTLGMLMLALSTLTLPAFAQTTGPSLLGSLKQRFADSKLYTVDNISDGIRVTDARTGVEVLSVHQINAQRVTITGVITDLSKLTPEARVDVLKRIAFFNFSSPVGTMMLDESTGKVIMKHELNPRMVSVPAMVNVAARFGDVARLQATTLRQASMQ